MTSAIFDAFIPVWPNRRDHTKIVMQRIGAALLPEMPSNDSLKHEFSSQLLERDYNSFEDFSGHDFEAQSK